MEALLRNLQEQEYELKQQRFNFHDLINMEHINDREPPDAPRRKYMSIFRIDGEPILPPLMTTEKRRQMQKIKEKALKVEQRIRERKQLLNKENDITNEDIISITSRSSACNTVGNVSQRSQDYCEVNLKETEESMILLQNLIQKQGENKNDTIDMEGNSGYDTKSSAVENNQEKLLKLQKSEILIFDNCTNEVIQITPDNATTKTREDHRKQLIELERKANLNYLPPKKPSHLLLAGVDVEGIPSIPSICLNPPTPLTGNRNICDQLNSIKENNDSFTNSKIQNESLNLVEDISSDDSFNSMLTHADRTPSLKNLPNIPKHTTKTTEIQAGKINNKKSTKKALNVSNKIQQFEALCSETTTPPSSPEKSYQSSQSCLKTPTCTMNRSATSPSIKLPTSQRSSSARSQSLAQDSDNSPDCTLVRSSSFTLEGPSKALIDHMRQQKTINDTKRNVKTPLNINRTTARKAISTPLRSHRDTVESKAKKVQKVELKSSKQKILQKTSQSKLAQAAVTSSLSPYNCNSLSQHSHNHLYKPKKSPYDTTKTMQNSLQTIQKSTSFTNRKSPSSSISQMKSNKTQVLSSPTQTPTSTLQNSVKSLTGKEAISQMDKTQKEKFLRLLAQQEEEQRRLQQSFEMQQKMLIEQLNTEMGTIQKKSPTNSKNSSSTTAASQRHEKQSQLTYHLQNQLNLTGFSSDTKSDKPLLSHSSQPSPTISNNSSHLYFTTNAQSEAAMIQQTSFSSQYDETPVPTPPNTPNLSSVDHSNANTSLDISTLSIQTSPDSLCTTTPTNISNSYNISGNKSSSRRRLFTSGMTGQDAGTTKAVNARSTPSSSHPSLSHSTEHTQQQQQKQLQHNKSSMGLSHNSSNRRPIEQHAAATKINAWARGFLVRRLFQTEQIQRIVQTIRDTLIFVLNLHLETMENPEESHTPVNIKLKARLLQQLTSACRTLHLVFFQTSIKERMEIIARDRKRIKTKLLSMNRKRCYRDDIAAILSIKNYNKNVIILQMIKGRQFQNIT